MNGPLERIGVNQLVILDLLKSSPGKVFTRKQIEQLTGLSLGQVQSALRGLHARGVSNKPVGDHVRSPRVYWYEPQSG